MTKRKPREKKVTFDKPKAPGGLCWDCDRPLYAGGRSYVMREVNGEMRPCHTHCDGKPRT